MAFEHKPGQFSLFKNDKEGNEQRPDYAGNGMDLDGKMIRVAAWKKYDKNENMFLSCRIEVQKPKPQARDDLDAPKQKQDSGKLSDIESDIPFN